MMKNGFSIIIVSYRVGLIPHRFEYPLQPIGETLMLASLVRRKDDVRQR